MGRYVEEKIVFDGINEEEITTDITGKSTTMLTAEDEKGIYILGTEGIFYLAEGEALLEKAIDGKYFTMSAPSAYIYNACVHNGIFYMEYGLDNMFICKQYVYHKELPTVPEKTLTIFALEGCKSLQSAARLYADQHPEIRVEVNVIETGEEIDEQTKNQAIEAINTKILAGEAPDIMVLDGLPIEAYRDKDVLADMSSILDAIKQEGSYYDSLMRTYEKDQKIYALPLSFDLISAAGESELVKDGFNLEALAAYQKQHPNEQVLANTVPEDLVQKMSGI